MNHALHVITHNPILLGIVILLLATIVYAVLKRLAKLALFLVAIAVAAWIVLQFAG